MFDKNNLTQYPETTDEERFSDEEPETDNH